MSPRTRWHVVAYGPAVLLATLTAPGLLLGGSPVSALAVLLAAVVVAIQAWSFRARYKTGWHDGRVDLTRELTGDPDYHGSHLAPEPWVPRPAVGVAVHRHGGDEAPGHG